MEEIYLWESKLKDNYLYFSDIQSYFKYLEDNNLNMSFLVKDGYTQGESTEDILDNIAKRDNIKVKYTNELHPIVIAKDDIRHSWIDPTFFEEHIKEFREHAIKRLLKDIASKKSNITIPDFIFCDEILKIITTNEEIKDTYFSYKTFYKDKELTNEQKSILEKHHLQFYAYYRNHKNEEISSKYIISYYTMDKLKALKSLSLSIPIDDKTIANLIYVNEDAEIELDYSNKLNNNEEEYLKIVMDILNKLSSHNKKYIIKISLDNREVLRKSNLLNKLPSNIDLKIRNDLYTYNLEEYNLEEDKLEKLVKPIRDSNLSPLEKYLAIYDIVKKFKPYKENEEDLSKSRYLRYILDDDNEFIVCVGFAKLFSELLNRVGIPNKTLSVSADISYDKGFTEEEKQISLAGHARNLVRITDPKYNIDGYYIADTTWDNSMQEDLFLNSVMTFDRKKEAKRLEALNTEDLLLDFHDFNEFKEKIDYYLKSEINKQQDEFPAIITVYKNYYNKIRYSLDSEKRKKFENIYEKNFYELVRKMKKEDLIKLTKTSLTEMLTEYSEYINKDNKQNINSIIIKETRSAASEMHNQAIINAYKKIYKDIQSILVKIDKDKYNELYNKYNNYFTNNNIALKELEPIASQMLTEYAKYIIPLSNNKVAISTLLQAEVEIKRKLNKMSEEEIKEWLDKTKKENKKAETKYFPYTYNPENKTEAYLEDASHEETTTYAR